MQIRDILDNPSIYLLWQSPFVRQKLKPLKESLTDVAGRRVLDVGCGPGTNAPAFDNAGSYLGVDLNEAYINYARRRFKGRFEVHDVTHGPPVEETFDLILLNSLMHHLDDDEVCELVGSLPSMLEPGGEIHIIDLVMAERGLPRALAKADRGAYARTVASWRSLVSSRLAISECKEFAIGLGPLKLWNLVYIRATGSAG